MSNVVDFGTIQAGSNRHDRDGIFSLCRGIATKVRYLQYLVHRQEGDDSGHRSIVRKRSIVRIQEGINSRGVRLLSKIHHLSESQSGMDIRLRIFLRMVHLKYKKEPINEEVLEKELATLIDKVNPDSSELALCIDMLRAFGFNRSEIIDGISGYTAGKIRYITPEDILNFARTL